MKKQLTKQELIRELEAIDNLNNKANNEQTKRIEQLEYCTDKLINKLLEINEKYTKLQIKLQEYDNKERQDVIDEIKFNEDFYKKEFNFTEKEIDKIVKLYKEFLEKDTKWNELVNKAIRRVIDEREHKNGESNNIKFEVYEVHTLYEDGTTKFRDDFQTMIDAIKYYNSLDNISKELVINTNDEEFNTIYGYYAENNTGINKIDIIKLGGLKND